MPFLGRVQPARTGWSSIRPRLRPSFSPAPIGEDLEQVLPLGPAPASRPALAGVRAAVAGGHPEGRMEATAEKAAVRVARTTGPIASRTGAPAAVDPGGDGGSRVPAARAPSGAVSEAAGGPRDLERPQELPWEASRRERAPLLSRGAELPRADARRPAGLEPHEAEVTLVSRARPGNDEPSTEVSLRDGQNRADPCDPGLLGTADRTVGIEAVNLDAHVEGPTMRGAPSPERSFALAPRLAGRAIARTATGFREEPGALEDGGRPWSPDPRLEGLGPRRRHQSPEDVVLRGGEGPARRWDPAVGATEPRTPTEVTVSIGRVEVRVEQPEGAAARKPAAAPPARRPSSLEAYLRARSAGHVG